MKGFTNRVFAAFMTLTLALSVAFVVPTETKAAETKSAYVTIEKLTIGQGFVMTPVKVEIAEGDKVGTVVDKAAKAEGVELIYTASDYGAYLSGIKNADNGKVDIPKEITDMGDFISEWGSYPAPTNDNVRANSNEDGLLSEYTYTDMSGWMYTVNNESSYSGAEVNDGDVIRLQFSIYGWGLDLGHRDFETKERKINLADKNALIKTVAEIKAAGNLSKSKTLQNVYDSAIETLEMYAPSQIVVDAADSILTVADKAYAEAVNSVETTTPGTEAATVPTVKKVTIKSVKNVKTRKAKIKIKKVSNATGYEYKYSTNKKFKTATIKTSTKTSIKTTKQIKNKTVYARVRAYVTVNGTKCYGKWSSAKSVKITK